MADFFKHFADLAIAAFDDGDFEPGVVAFADEADFRGRSAHAASAFFGDGDAAAKFVELGFVGLAGDFHDVNFRHMRSGFHQAVRESSVVGHEQKAFAGPVEAAHGIDASVKFAT